MSEEKFKECDLNVECYIDVAPVHVETPSQFCCHVVQNAVEFKNMTDDLNQFYATVPADPSITWKKLMPCVALYNGNNALFVSLVIKYSNFVFSHS